MTDIAVENHTQETFHLGHLKAVLLVAALLFGISWMCDPNLFSVFTKSNASQTADSADVPRYYAYVPPAEDQQPMVLGASTQPQGPSIINDDGSVSSVDMGQVLGASTQGVQLSLDNIAVKTIPDSDAAIKKYFSDAQAAENGSINQADFAAALTSGNQDQINAQAGKLNSIVTALQKLAVPQSLAKLQKLKIIQYNSAIALLQNFTTADQNPETTSQDLQQFMKAQQDLDTENATVAQKFPDDDPLAAIYAEPAGVPAGDAVAAAGSDDMSNSFNAAVDNGGQ